MSHGIVSPSQILFLNNYKYTGIGDFGWELIDALSRAGHSLRIVETNTSWIGFHRLGIDVLGWAGQIIVNIGLTAWGSSPIRNLMGIGVLAAKSHTRVRPTILLHNVIEVIQLDQSGYQVSSLTRAGAHQAVAALRRSPFVVFSRAVGESLDLNYGIRPELVWPIPCSHEPGVKRGTPSNDLPIVVSPGYFSPYKGLTDLESIRRLVRSRCGFVTTAAAHRVLSASGNYTRSYESGVRKLRESGVTVTGYLPRADFEALLSSATVGLLPYYSTQGGSASFAKLASFGLPVIAPKLPEFEWLEGLGAGLLLTGRSPEQLAEGIDRVITEDHLRLDLIHRQREFARKFSWTEFVRALDGILD